MAEWETAPAVATDKWETAPAAGQTWETEQVPIEEPAQPGSLSFALQGAGAGLETTARMIAGMTGAGVGALGAGVAAIPDVLSGNLEEAAPRIREAMTEGSQRAVAPLEAASRALTGRPTMYAPTEMFEQALGEGAESLQQQLGVGAEIMETARGKVFGNPQPELARTAGEYAFEAAAVTAPFMGIKAAASAQSLRRARVLEQLPRTPPQGSSPRDIARGHLENLKEVARDSDPKAYEIPDTPTVVEAELTTQEAIRRFHERAGEVAEGPVTETELTSNAVRDFQAGRDPFKGPGKKQAGAIDFRGWTRPQRQSEFERELGLEKGMGLALPDLTTPLDIRAKETIQIGKDIAIEKGQEVFEKLPNDMGSLLGKYGLTAEHTTKYVGVDNPVLKAFIDRVTEKHQMVDAMREDLLAGDQLQPHGVSALRYTKRTWRGGFAGPFKDLGKHDQMELARLNLASDAAREELASLKQQWFTREDMAKRGFSETAIKNHLHEQEYMDIMYDIVNHARALGGKEPIGRIPGWLPHTRSGNMRIQILRKTKDGEHVVAFEKASGGKKYLQQQANRAIEDVKKDIPDAELRAEIRRVDDVGGMADLIDQFESVASIYAQSDKRFSQMIAKSLQKRVAGMEQAFLQEGMKRAGVHGWIGQYGANAANLKQITALRANYIENGLKYLKAQEIQAIRNQISPEVWKELEKHTPNTADWINKFTDVARDRIEPNQLDKWIMDVVSELSGERLPYRASLWSLNKLRGLYSIKDLGWSVSYHIMNGVQPEMLGSAALVREASRMGKGNPATALMYAEKNIWAPSLDAKSRIEWAARHKVQSPRLMEEIDFMYKEKGGYLRQVGTDILTGRRTSEVNEAFGRLKTFLAGTEFYRNAGMTELQARQAAVKLTNDVMVDYSAIGQPLWLSNNPLGQHAGRFVAPYAAFQFSFLGQMALAIQAMKRNPGMARKLLPMVSLQMAVGTFAGLRGLTGFAELSWIASTFNTWWEDKFQTPGPLFDPMEALLKSKLSDFMLFGGLSATTKAVPRMEHGADVGVTGASPTLGSLIVPRVGTGVIELGTNVIPVVWKLLLNEEIPDSEKLKAIKGVTWSWTHGLWEAAFMKDVSVSPDPYNRMRGNVYRELPDWQAKMLTNKPSLNERRQLEAKHRIQEKEMLGKERKSDIVELAADFYDREGFLNPDHIDKAMEEGYRLKLFRERVKELREQRGTSRLRSLSKSKERTPTRQRIRREIEDMLDDIDIY